MCGMMSHHIFVCDTGGILCLPPALYLSPLYYFPSRILLVLICIVSVLPENAHIFLFSLADVFLSIMFDVHLYWLFVLLMLSKFLISFLPFCKNELSATCRIIRERLASSSSAEKKPLLRLLSHFMWKSWRYFTLLSPANTEQKIKNFRKVPRTSRMGPMQVLFVAEAAQGNVGI